MSDLTPGSHRGPLFGSIYGNLLQQYYDGAYALYSHFKFMDICFQTGEPCIFRTEEELEDFQNGKWQPFIQILDKDPT
jgi:hypothetical protein